MSHPTRRRSGRSSVVAFALVVVLAGCCGFAATNASTASNVVPATRVGRYTHGIGPNDLKPEGCTEV
jgi:hypothetical protein